MAQIANIVVNDGKATPVAHTFAPAKALADYALFEDRAGGIYVGYNKLTYTLTRPKGEATSNRNLKLMIKLETPVMETISNSTYSGIPPAPQVAYRPVVEVMLTLPERSTIADRKDLLALMKNVLSNAATTLAVEQYELPW